MPAKKAASTPAKKTAAKKAPAKEPASEPVEVPEGNTAPAVPPAPGPVSKPRGKTYTVKAGDTLGSVAKGLEVSVDDLRQANNLRHDLLYTGQKLRTP
jgi:LysM repeat protein